MENSADWEQNNLINELTQGRELSKLLQIHLNATSSSSSSSHETRQMLVENILSSYDKALSMLRLTGSVGEPRPTGAVNGMSESPLPLGGSPYGEDFDQDFKDHENKDASRKRKTMLRWTKQVQVCSGTGLERPLDDGHSWRKYGQKDILGAKYQRGYYKCTHRNVQGCMATKQVQRSDEDPTIFEITYRGSHTCTQGSHLNPAPSAASPQKQEPNTALDKQQLINQPHQNQQESKEILLNFQTGLKVRSTEELDTRNKSMIPSFSFPSTSHVNAENYVHSPSSMLDNNFARNFSPSFMSPATSGSNCFSVSPTHMTSFGGNQTLQSELMEIVSAATSATNSPTVGLDLPFGAVDQFEPTFSFDNPGFFS